jgi:hypothetical protein
LLSDANHQLIDDYLQKTVISLKLLDVDKQKPELTKMKKQVAETRCDDAQKSVSDVLAKVLATQKVTLWYNYTRAFAIDKRCAFTDSIKLNTLSIKASRIKNQMAETQQQAFVAEENKINATVASQTKEEVCDAESKRFVMEQL